jgi:hypothetical protein
MAKKKNPAAVALGKLRAKKGPSLKKIGALGGKAKAKPTDCPKCGAPQPSARQALAHCRKRRKSTHL